MANQDAQKNLPATQNIARGLQALANASKELQERVAEVKDNLESVENFKLPRVKMTSDGAQLIEGEQPLEMIEGTILLTKKTNSYYDKPYRSGSVEPPRCYSNDGERPVEKLKDKEGKELKPINATCKGCPMAEFGTNAMKSGKACRNLKPIYILLTGAIIPRQLVITPTGLKAANQYLMNLTEAGLNYRKVKTRISFFRKNPDDKFMCAKFEKAGKHEGQDATDIEALRNFWLPVMQDQVIDQADLDGASEARAPQAPVDTKGEF